MQLERTGYKIVDDYNLVFELINRTGISESEAEQVINSFFANFRVLRAYKNPTLACKETVAITQNDKLPELAKLPNKKQRMYLLLNNMPIKFTIDDYVNFMVKERYNADKVRSNAYQSDIPALIDAGKIKKIKHGMYEILDKMWDIQQEEINLIKSLKEGKKITMDTMH